MCAYTSWDDLSSSSLWESTSLPAAGGSWAEGLMGLTSACWRCLRSWVSWVGPATQRWFVFGFAQDSSLKVPGGDSLTKYLIKHWEQQFLVGRHEISVVLEVKSFSVNAVVHLTLSILILLLCVPPRRVWLKKREPVRHFYSFHWWSLPLPFLLLLLESPMAQWGLNPQLPACIVISTVHKSALTLSLSAIFQPWYFSSLPFTPILGALFKALSLAPSQSMPRRAGMFSLGGGGGDAC